MKKTTFSRKLLATILTLVIAFSMQVATVLAANGPAQGWLRQQATLQAQGAITVLVSPDQFTGSEGLQFDLIEEYEGQQYFLTQINDSYDITNNDVTVQVLFASGAAQMNATNWLDNGMRYISVINAANGDVVANWQNAAPDNETGTNNSEAYAGVSQISFSFVNNQNGRDGVLFTIPKEALAPGGTYYMVLGSAVCGNNPANMLYAPVIYLFTTKESGSSANIVVQDAYKTVNTNAITVTGAAAADIAFHRFTFEGPTEQYVVGVENPISASVPGQEICLVPFDENFEITDFANYEITIVGDDSGYEYLPNDFIPHGGDGTDDGSGGGSGSSNDFGDLRFTMPNEPVTITVEYYSQSN